MLEMEYIPEEEQRFRIESDEQAEWAISKIKDARENVQKWESHYNAMLGKIRENAESTIAYMTGLLEEYFDALPHSTTKGGTEKYALPSAELKRTPTQIELKHDDARLLEWCRVNAPEYIKVKESVAWAEVKKAIKIDGELPDGVEAVEKAAEFKVMI